MKKRHISVSWLLLLLLAACSRYEAEQTADLYLPTAVISVGSALTPPPSGATATFQPTAVIFPDTPTPPAVVTQAPRPTPTALPPTLIPSDVIVVQGERPVVSQDLLFIGEGDLRHWSRRDGAVRTLLYKQISGRQTLMTGPVHHFVTQADGGVVVAARAIPPQNVSSELWWVEVASGQTRQLVENVYGLVELALSPDGRSLLYVATDDDALLGSGTVYRLDLGHGSGPAAVGICTNSASIEIETPGYRACWGVSWTRDSQNMIWSDANGIWRRHIGASEAALTLPTAAESEAAFSPLYELRDWSLNGRYLLLAVTTQLNQSETAVLDLVTNQLITVPGTAVSETAGYVEVHWMQDGRLFVIREQDEAGQYAPALQLWRLIEGQIRLEESTSLQLPPHTWLRDAVHFVTGRFAFTLLADDPLVSGLYLMASSNEPARRVNGLPYLTGETIWLYDNGGAILAMPARDDAFVFLAVPSEPALIYELRPFLGSQATHFVWLPR